MGVKLMTGATGEQNIQAADDRECLAGITGRDSYVFPTGSKLKATLVDANTVTIGTGAGSLQGSRFRCSTTTTVTIQSGTQGQFRRDVIGLRFKRESSGRESMEFQVLTGDPASSDGAASDPSYAEGDLLAGDAEAFMPLYRVKLSGINAADPEPLFSVLTPLADLGDSVSQITRLWYKSYNTGVEPSAVTFTAPGGLDSYDYLVFFGKTSEWKRVSAVLSIDNSFDSQYFQLTAPYAPTGGTDIYERMTGYKVTFSGESVTVSPQWYNEVRFSANGCSTSTGKGVPLYEVVGVKRLP